MRYILMSILCGLAITGYGQDEKAVDALYHDFSIPDISAFTLLGINTNKVARPTSPKEIAAGIITLSSSGKSIPPGLAIEWAPWMTTNKQKINDSTTLYSSYQQYKRTRWQRNLLLSFATIQDSTGSNAAFGVSYNVYDKSDPSYSPEYMMSVISLTKGKLNPLNNYTNLRYDYLNNREMVFDTLGINTDTSKLIDDSAFFDMSAIPSKKDILNSFIRILGITSMKDERLKLISDLTDYYIATLTVYRNNEKNDAELYARLIAKAKADYKNKYWNAGVLKFGIGTIWNSPNYTWKQLQNYKLSGFGSWAFPLWHWGQAIALCQYAYNFSDSSMDARQFIAGGRIVAGGNKVHGSIEGVYENDTYKQIGELPKMSGTNNYRSTIGIEFRMNDGLWLELATGVQGKSGDFWRNASMLTFANVKYTFKKEARYNIN